MFRDCFQHLPNIERKRIVTAENTILRLNRGERPEPLPFDLQRKIQGVLRHCGVRIQEYPSYQKFYDQLAKHVCFPKEQIVVGAGIEEFIRTLMFLCCDPGQKAVVLWPTCAMYDIYAEAFGVELIRIKPKPGEKFGMEQFINAIPADPSIRVVFVPNPGQPVETYFNPIQLRILADYCKTGLDDAVLAVDEAHYGFGAETALPLVDYYPNVLVMRTFSKWYGAASIRVGYVVGQPRTIRYLDAVRPSGEVTGPSMAVATVLMDNWEELQFEAGRIVTARDWAKREIEGMGLQVWGEVGFSLLIELKGVRQMTWVVDNLANSGVYVKGRFPKPVHHHILVSCGKQQTMEQFVASFRYVYEHTQEMA